MTGWRPTLGAWPDEGGFRFRVWAPERHQVAVVLAPGTASARTVPLERQADGTWTGLLADVAAGTRYGFTLDDTGPFPDPASRFQPDGVHAWSQTVSPAQFTWSDAGWAGVPLSRAVFYELHVGTFTPEGTFAAAAARLPMLADLGITVVELMPLADFPGGRNWGYDGVCLFAPARCYGTPDDLRAFVDTAHALGLAVVIDVVYNHFGPDGAYAFTYSPLYASTRHTSPWGAAMNFDGESSDQVRAFVIENALHWLHEYHADGLRLDATHAIRDDSPVHVVAELTTAARASLPHRTLLIIAEDERNLASVIQPAERGGWGCDGVWADDFHHQVRRLAAGDEDGYYADYTGTVRDLATTVDQGWFYVGQHSAYRAAPHGSMPDGIGRHRMIVALQNHDQIGNRALGERLNEHVDPRLLRALAVLLITVPETPLIFMGQEWAASTPFLYFTDHHGDLGRAVTEGRRREFGRFAAFRHEAAREAIPDPQDVSTFLASRLQWDEADQPVHRGLRTLYRVLLRLRHTEAALQADAACSVDVLDDDTLVLQRTTSDDTLAVVVRVRGAGQVRLPAASGDASSAAWSLVLSSEADPFAATSRGVVPTPPEITTDPAGALIDFAGPAAVMLRWA